MRSKFYKIAQVVGVSLALSFTLSCSSSIDNGDSSSSVNSSSSSSVNSGVLSSSSESVIVSSSSVVPSSSSAAPIVPSSSSIALPSSSSVIPSSSSVPPQTGIIRGEPVYYEGETYETVVIGTQTWMARNLNYNVEGSKCYNDDSADCTTYGRFYDWTTAMALPDSCKSGLCASQVNAKHRGICPSGWHIPNNADWDKLMRYVDGSIGTSSPYNSPTAGRYLKATSSWNNCGPGGSYSYKCEDTYGFSAISGGNGGYTGSFNEVGIYSYWWSSSELSSNNAYCRFMFFSLEYADYYDYYKGFLFNVRCLQD